MARRRVKGGKYALLKSFGSIMIITTSIFTAFNLAILKQTTAPIENTKKAFAFNFVNTEASTSKGELDENRIVFFDTDATPTTNSTETKVRENSAQKALKVHHDIIPDDRKYKTMPSCNSHCLSSMGKDGAWVQDWNFAKNYGQFPLPWVIPAKPLLVDHELQFQPTLDSPFPWRTSWKWIDEDADCHVDPMTPEVVCNVLDELGADRIAFYGDSLTESQFQSFVNMMGPDNTRKIESTTDRDVSDEIGLVCRRNKTGHEDETDDDVIVPIFYQRSMGEAAHKQVESAYDFSEELNSFINQSEKRMLGVFNIGAHYHNETLYQEDLSKMLDLISAFDRNQDLYFFRTTSPGHAYCEPRKPWDMDWTKGVETEPFSSIDEMRWDNVVARRWNWEKFQYHNKHTKDIMEEKHRTGKIPMVHIFDVYNMTALRSDGHRGGTDCLHYAYPGPIDWWNHFLFTYLKELSRVLSRENMVNCRAW